MDLFKYTAAIKEIDKCDRVSEMEILVRRYCSLCPIYANNFKSDSIYYYKLYTYSLNKFKILSKRVLPDFIYGNKESTQINLLSTMLEAHIDHEKKTYKANSDMFSKTPSYEELMNYFEFDELLVLDRSQWYVEKLNEIIGDKPVHFKVKFNYLKTNFDNYSTTLEKPIQILLYAIRYKQVNFPDKHQTIWDMFIENCIQAAKPFEVSEQEISTSIIKLQQQISALEALEGYLK